MKLAEPVDTRELFAEERSALLELLRSLSPTEWQSPTVCEGWNVKDIVAHIVGDDLGPLSHARDGWSGGHFEPSNFEELVALINEANDMWVRAMRRLSPRVLVELLERSGAPYIDVLTSQDLHSLGGPVDWAGPGPKPVWLDVAREYTERWLHQQHIRDAVGRSGLRDARHLGAVLRTFAYAIPRAYESVDADAGSAVTLRVTGDAGGTWSAVRTANSWELYEGDSAEPAATAEMDDDTAWRLFTRGLAPDEARRLVALSGPLAEPILNTVAILA